MRLVEKTSRIIYFLILCSGLLACQSDNSRSKKLISGNPEFVAAFNTDTVRPINASQIFPIAKQIQLETNESCFISNIDKLLVTEDSIILILDRNQLSIFLFDVNGRYLRKIHNFGDGPEQYVSIKDFSYDGANKKILILDFSSKSIVEYGIAGQFIRKKRIPNLEDIGGKFDYFNGKYLFLRNNTDVSDYSGQAALLDTGSWKVENHGIEIKDGLKNHTINSSHPLDIHNDSTFLLPFLYDTVYYISKEGIRPYLSLSYNNANPIIKEFDKGKLDEDKHSILFDRLYQSNGTWGFNNLFVFEKYVVISFMHNMKNYWLIYNKVDKKSNIFFINYDKGFFPPPIGKWNDLLISTLFKQQQKGVTESNPGLIFYSLNPNL